MHVHSGGKPNLVPVLPPWTIGFKGFTNNSGTAGSPIITQLINKTEIREKVRQSRRALSASQRRMAAKNLLRNLRQFPHFQYSQHIAIYLTNDGEIDTSVLIQDLNRRGKTLYLPVLQPCKKGYLNFVRWHSYSRMTKNRFNIAEPVLETKDVISPTFLQLICMPLVAFDAQGNRLGMGGGFYDRSLAHMANAGNKPALLGLAYELQRVDHLPVEPWDIALDAIATDKQLYLFS